MEAKVLCRVDKIRGCPITAAKCIQSKPSKLIYFKAHFNIILPFTWPWNWKPSYAVGKSHNVISNRESWHKQERFFLNSRGGRFKPRPGRQLPCLKFAWFFRVPPGECWDSSLKITTAACFTFLLISSTTIILLYHSTINNRWSWYSVSKYTIRWNQ
jgi:hypothetical protein